MWSAASETLPVFLKSLQYAQIQKTQVRTPAVAQIGHCQQGELLLLVLCFWVRLKWGDPTGIVYDFPNCGDY